MQPLISLYQAARRLYRPAAALLAPLALSGCVLGYGPCLLLKPIKHTFTGRIHFKQYPGPYGLDNVPVLTLDSTEYVYAPAQSTHCLAANDVQLEGLAEFPEDVIENSHVTVQGGLFEAVDAHQHTPLLINVTNILPIRDGKPESPSVAK